MVGWFLENFFIIINIASCRQKRSKVFSLYDHCLVNQRRRLILVLPYYINYTALPWFVCQIVYNACILLINYLIICCDQIYKQKINWCRFSGTYIPFGVGHYVFNRYRSQKYRSPKTCGSRKITMVHLLRKAL